MAGKAKRGKLTKLDEAILRQDKDEFVRWTIHQARTNAGLARRILASRAKFTTAESGSLVERAELWLEQAEDLEAYAIDVREGRAPAPWEPGGGIDNLGEGGDS
jgi:hypothetical protein